jgi:hypothetical protein
MKIIDYFFKEPEEVEITWKYRTESRFQAFMEWATFVIPASLIIIVLLWLIIGNMFFG